VIAINKLATKLQHLSEMNRHIPSSQFGLSPRLENRDAVQPAAEEKAAGRFLFVIQFS
jgi:hypothetical protein